MSVLAGQDEPSVPVLAGWRRDLVGAEPLELLAGHRTITVGKRGLLRSGRAASATAGRGRLGGEAAMRTAAPARGAAGRRGSTVTPLAGGEAQLVLIVCAQQLVCLDAELEAVLDRRQLEDRPGPYCRNSSR